MHVILVICSHAKILPQPWITLTQREKISVQRAVAAASISHAEAFQGSPRCTTMMITLTASIIYSSFHAWRHFERRILKSFTLLHPICNKMTFNISVSFSQSWPVSVTCVAPHCMEHKLLIFQSLRAKAAAQHDFIVQGWRRK